MGRPGALKQGTLEGLKRVQGVPKKKREEKEKKEKKIPARYHAPQ